CTAGGSMSSRAFITSEQRGALGFLPLARSTALSPTGGTAAPYVADDCNSVAGSRHYSSPDAFVRVLVAVLSDKHLAQRPGQHDVFRRVPSDPSSSERH
ncbi:hypothetical protein KUCAC02_018701, partial [Chaenocephalus aceratus]